MNLLCFLLYSIVHAHVGAFMVLFTVRTIHNAVPMHPYRSISMLALCPLFVHHVDPYLYQIELQNDNQMPPMLVT